MKKNCKILLCSAIAVLLVFTACFCAGAETYFEYDGYTYTVHNNTSISLAGWNNSTTDLVVPDKILSRYFISVANKGLAGNTVITSVDFSDTTRLKRIGMYAFSGCTGINQTITMPSALTTINEGAFQNCTSLPGIICNSSLVAIPEQCFYGCTMLSDVQLNDGLQRIERIAFANCPSLEYIEIPQSVSFIDPTAFYNCNNLTLGVYDNSYALQFAVNNNIPYVIIDGYEKGDVNLSGNVDITDATLIQKYCARMITFTEQQLRLADVNNTGVVDVRCATTIQRMIAGLI